jgi:uncharacterized membrane protein YjjP (DUF1212 family)
LKAATEKILDLSGRMGLLLMNNGGEVQRAEDIMHRVCLSSKEITSADALATPGWVIITVHAHGQSFTSMTRTKPGRSDLSRVQTVNEIARAYLAGSLQVEEADRLLDEMLERPARRRHLQLLGGILAPMCITLLGRTGLVDALAAGFASACLVLVDRRLDPLGIAPFMHTFLVSMVGAFVALLLHKIGVVDNIAQVLIGSIMVQFPGILLANSVRDSLSGDVITGQSGMIQALATALALGMGVGFMLLLFGGSI